MIAARRAGPDQRCRPAALASALIARTSSRLQSKLFETSVLQRVLQQCSDLAGVVTIAIKRGKSVMVGPCQSGDGLRAANVNGLLKTRAFRAKELAHRSFGQARDCAQGQV